MHPKIDVGKRSEKGRETGCQKGAILDQNPLKIDSKNDAKFDVEKVWKIHEKLTKNGAKIDAKIKKNRYNFRTSDFLFFAKSPC